MSKRVDRREFIRRAGGSIVAASAALGSACDDVATDAPAISVGDDFSGIGAGWGSRWSSVRYETRVGRSDGTAFIEVEPPPRKAITPEKPHALYMAAPMLFHELESRDAVVQAEVRAKGPAQVGVLARAGFDEAYALLVEGGQALLSRYAVRERIDLARKPLPRTEDWLRVTLETRGNRISGVVEASGREIRLAANDDALGRGFAGAIANPLVADRGGRALLRNFRVTSSEERRPPRPRPLYAFTGGVIQDDDRARARVTARSVLPAPIAFEIAGDESFSDSMVTKTTPAEGRFGAVRAWLDDLERGTTYHWRPLLINGDKRIPGPARRFRTPPAAGSPVRFVFASCTSGRETRFPSFAKARALDPDFYLHAGDWGYADQNSFVRRADHFQARWTRLLRVPEIATLLEDTPLLFWQDDHDYQADNGWRGTVQPYSVGAFDAIHANPSDDYFDFRYGDVHVWCLDCRLHADDPALPDTADKSRIGKEQKVWLKEGITRSDAPVQIVASPMAFRNKDPDDPGWHNVYSAERDELLAFFAELQSAVVILSGDSHGQRLIHHFEFGELYEITSSGTDFPAGGGQGNNDPEHTLVNVDDRSGFALIEVSGGGPGREARVRCVDRLDGSTIFEHVFPVPRS